jgi:hypothetical protein
VTPKQLITVDFTDEELAAYARVAERETYGDSGGAFWAMVAVGFVAALARDASMRVAPLPWSTPPAA